MVGVDTHRDEHTLALVGAATGALLAQRTVASNGRGYAQALRFAQQQAGVSASGRWRAPVTTVPALPAT